MDKLARMHYYIIECIGSDGIPYKQLVKGKDDLRQDAVMQQIFQMVNVLLQAEPETQKRQLHIRTYKVLTLILLRALNN